MMPQEQLIHRSWEKFSVLSVEHVSKLKIRQVHSDNWNTSWRLDLVESSRNIVLSVSSGRVWPPFPPWRSPFIALSPPWSLKRHLKRDSASERTHSLLPTEFIKLFFFLFLPVCQYSFHCLPPTSQAQEVCILGCHFTGGKMVHENGKTLASRVHFHSTVGV